MFPLKESGRWWNCHKLIKAVSDSYSQQLVMPDRMVAVAYSGSEAYKGLGKRKGEMMEEEEMKKPRLGRYPMGPTIICLSYCTIKAIPVLEKCSICNKKCQLSSASIVDGILFFLKTIF